MNYLFSNKDLKKLIIPLVLEQALAISVGMADTVMVSSVGEVAVSGVSLVDMLNYLFFSFFAALATGGAVIVSQHIGENDINSARGAAKQLLAVVGVISIALTATVLAFRRGLLGLLFGQIEPAVMEACMTYLTISALSFPFLGIYNSCAALFRSMGRTDITFKISVIGNIINVAGNALCVYVFKMGVAGVAVPTLISRVFMALALYVMLRKPKWLVFFENGRFKPDWREIKKILYIGIPGGVENSIFQLGRVIVVSIISGFGTAQIAANGIANTIDMVGILSGQAIGLAMITVIGQCVGANDVEQIKYYTKKLLLITYTMTAAINIPLLIALNPILSLFNIGAEASSIAYILVMIHNGSAILLWPVSFVLPNMLRACNDVKYTMICSILSMWTFRVGFSLVFASYMGMGVIGVWIAMILDWLCRVACFVIRYFRGKWKITMNKMRTV